MLTIAVSAPSSSAAVARTSALAKGFLQFRATYLQNQQKLLATEINQQVSQAQQRLAALTTEINQVSAQPTTATQQARLKNLEAQSGAQANIVQTSHATLSAAQTTMATIVNGSQLLNVRRSRPSIARQAGVTVRRRRSYRGPGAGDGYRHHHGAAV